MIFTQLFENSNYCDCCDQEITQQPHQCAVKEQGSKTTGVALSKAYKKDFTGQQPQAQRTDTALSGAYSKTGKPGGPLLKKGVAESGNPKWWAYLHSNGSIQVKRYLGPDSMDGANESPFVVRVFNPIEAPDLNTARQEFAKAAQSKEPVNEIFADRIANYADGNGITADKLNVSDDVVITGDVKFQGKTGIIDSFGRDKRFVVVNLYNHGKHSFHSSDVEGNDYPDRGDDEAELTRFEGKHEGVAEDASIQVPTQDGIDWQDIRLLAGEGKLTQKTIKQAIDIIRKQRKEKEGVAEGNRFDEPLTGYHIVYRKSGQVVHATPSFETQDAAQKYLMTRMFANHQDYRVAHTSGVLESRKPSINFDIEDIKRLEQIRDLDTLKAQAIQLIGRPSQKPMKPEKVAWFQQHLKNMGSPMQIIKLMYDLMLSGEGHAVIGGRHSTNPNSYRTRFGEEAHTNEAAKPTRRSMPYSVWQSKSADDQRFIKSLYPDLVITDQPRVRKAKPQREKINYEEIARKIEQVVGSTFPDGDPIDLLIPYMRRRWGLEYDIGQHLDRAARRHLGARNYDDYLATLWDQVADDDLMPDHVTRDNNPWRPREGLRDPRDNPCWKGYHPVGTKQKNGRTVPNCVPKK